MVGRVRVQVKRRHHAQGRCCADDATRDRVEVAGRHLDGQRQRNGGSGGGSLEHWRQWLGGHPGTRPPRGECQAAWSCWVRPGEVQELSSGSAKGGYFDHAAPPSCRSRSRAKRSARCQRKRLARCSSPRRRPGKHREPSLIRSRARVAVRKERVGGGWCAPRKSPCSVERP